MHILIRQTDDAEQSPFQAEISFDRGTCHPIAVSDPFDAKQEAELEWYFETWLELPFINTVRAKNAAQSVVAYGETLFAQVFTGRKILGEYDRAKMRGVSQFNIEIAGSPAFHALHWEAIKDPDRPMPLAVEATVSRKLITPATEEVQPHTQVTLNILMVVARPGGRRDVGYRTIARPLVQALRDSKIRARIDIVRPGTYEGLNRHLQNARREHGDGFYHIVHFDMHGSLLEYGQYLAQLVKKAEATGGSFDDAINPYLFDGRSEFVPVVDEFKGQRGFLAFVSAREGWSDLVVDTDVAALLQTYQIPIAVLNACQSGKQVGAVETSLGARLVAAGVQQVVAMGYSVTVTAAERLMTTVYQQLLGGAQLPHAMQQGRWELHKRKQRRAYFNEEIPLEDWMLPVVYQNRPVALTLRDFHTLDEENAFYAAQAARYRAPRPEYGFVGRDVDILELERRLLRDAHSNLLLVRGMGGAGKTTLLRHVMAWWQTTGFVERVVYFGYDEKAWTVEQISDSVGRALLGDAQYNRQLQPLLPQARQEKLIGMLRATRHLLVLDNLESITGTNLAVLHTLDAKEQARLRGFVQALVGGRTLVLLGSRGGEEWILGDQAAVTAARTYHLPGLDAEAAAALAERILERYDRAAYRSEPAFRALLQLLDGYPLALEVVLSNLQRQTPQAVLAALQAADASIDPQAEAGDKTHSIVRCIEYSHSNLSAAAQELLLCLAPFTGVVNTSLLGNYVEALQQQPELAHLDHNLWNEVVQEAVNWGLLTPHEQLGEIGYLRLQPVFPYFLKTRLGEGEKAESGRRKAEGGRRKAAIEAAFRAHYAGVGWELTKLITSSKPQERQVGQALIGVEYENLMTAVRLSLATQTDFYNAYDALFRYLLALKQYGQNIDLCMMILAAQATYSEKILQGDMGENFGPVMDRLAYCYLDTKQYELAIITYEQELELQEGLLHLDERKRALNQASILHQLGSVAQAQRQWDAAEAYYQQALAIKREFDDRYAQASTLHQLGIVAQEQRQWDSAEAYYQQALAIFREFDDRHPQATVLHQLGRVAEEQRQWDSAEVYYQQALAIFREFDDRHPQATVLHQLGRVAQEQRQWDSAAAYYQQALAIKRDFDDRYAQASTLHQLGSVAQEQRQWDSAEAYYQQALAIYRDFDDRYEQAGTLHQLGRVAQAQRQWDSAEAYYQQALAIKREFDDRYAQASTLHQLGIVAQAQRQWDSAEAYYQQALAIFREFDDRHPQATVLHQLGSVAQAQRQWDSAEAYYQQALAIDREFDDRYAQASTLQQLGSVAQAQRQWDSAVAYYQQALAIKREFDDRYAQAGTLHQLGRVAEAQRQWDSAEAYYQQALAIKREFDDRYSMGSTLNQLGVVHELQEQWEQSADYYLQAIAIAVEFNDEYRLKTRLQNLRNVWQTTQAQASPVAAAIVERLVIIFNATPEQVTQLLREEG